MLDTASILVAALITIIVCVVGYLYSPSAFSAPVSDEDAPSAPADPNVLPEAEVESEEPVAEEAAPTGEAEVKAPEASQPEKLPHWFQPGSAIKHGHDLRPRALDNTWTNPKAASFKVRSSTYLKDKVKAPANADPMFMPIGC